MTGSLDGEAREILLRKAETARQPLDKKVAGEAATALAILRRDGLSVLEQALAPSTHVELGASTGHWHAFRQAVAPTLAEVVREHGPDAAAYFLGWLKRLALISEPRGATRRSQAATRRSPQVPTSGLSVGAFVEAVLLEERTKKGGWKARYEPSGRSGAIQNSADVPATAKPGDVVTLVVAAVPVRGEIAFRVPTEPAELR